ncbi:hypothetical protein QTH30_14685 [Clostridium perfringens]|uniref:hypothetical protein n=1 Tax=Clostridium perfringens TaxID=1502 RepID=UPI002468F84F|nr:hypothetical protein [Clostridium perfringens]MDH5087779.1 hypothetical protein [Clostridium perfringens]MDM0520020.1 hypothetical protein [Clostridium perfringens]MDM0657417.1 hypothetical protein [Clostridium perfringens]MDM0944572.1 hypothetical protein [Clostridium perfringens]
MSIKEKERETYSFMVSNKTEDGLKMNEFLKRLTDNGVKIGTYVKKLIEADMKGKLSIDNSCSNNLITDSNAIIKQMESQQALLKELVDKVNKQSEENNLLKTFIEKGISFNVVGNLDNVNTATASVVTGEPTFGLENDSILDAEELTLKREAMKASENVAPGLGGVDFSWKDDDEDLSLPNIDDDNDEYEPDFD